MEATGWFRRSALPMKQYSGAELGVNYIENPDCFLHVKKVCFSCAFKTTTNQVVFSAAIRGRQTMEIYVILGKFTQHPRILEWSPWALVPVSCRWSSETQSMVGFPRCSAYVTIQTRNLGLQLPRDWVEMWVWLKLFIPKKSIKCMISTDLPLKIRQLIAGWVSYVWPNSSPWIPW